MVLLFVALRPSLFSLPTNETTGFLFFLPFSPVISPATTDAICTVTSLPLRSNANRKSPRSIMLFQCGITPPSHSSLCTNSCFLADFRHGPDRPPRDGSPSTGVDSGLIEIASQAPAPPQLVTRLLAAFAVAKEQRRHHSESRGLVIVADVADQRRAPQGIAVAFAVQAVVWMHDHPDLHEGHLSPGDDDVRFFVFARGVGFGARLRRDADLVTAHGRTASGNTRAHRSQTAMRVP